MIYVCECMLNSERIREFLREIDQRAHQEIYHLEYSEVLRSMPLMIMISIKEYAFQLAFARFSLNFNTGC